MTWQAPASKELIITSFYRRGESGTWKEYFTKEQLAWFEPEAGEALKLIGSNPILIS